MSLSYISHFTMQTCEHIYNIRRKVRWWFFLRSKLGTNSARVCKDKSEEDVRVGQFEYSMEFFPDVKAEQAIVWETDIANGRFVFLGEWGVCVDLVEKVFKGFIEDVGWVTIAEEECF